jgi:hypothetical protein
MTEYLTLSQDIERKAFMAHHLTGALDGVTIYGCDDNGKPFVALRRDEDITVWPVMISRDAVRVAVNEMRRKLYEKFPA